MAAQGGQDKQEENVKHDFQFNANLDNEIVTLTCEDKAQNKKYACNYTKQDYQNIDDEFLKMKKAIEGGNAQINPPSYNNGPLVVKAAPYEFTLKQVN
eukprot:CAMPEP_0201563690 /NCGR_PEP_ID=MMETSP0190_2-20130828/911_1 /ASSEMBLY_ACC=CAM_ASM_000263 /TAXON_ID=37353 /ORGANISM="Rosalina sp." /LENGTH=97 /DNA_ID=CAMNT_0047978791 /DNA_START=84 /DNA_END=377 /DNA_ORIENTATION=+